MGKGFVTRNSIRAFDIELLYIVMELVNASLQKVQTDDDLGYFENSKDKACRLHIVENLLIGLNRENQNIAINIMFDMLNAQINV